MPKFAFTYPAKIIFAERNVEMVHHHYDGLDFYTGPINKNIWFCSETQKVKVTNYSNHGYDIVHLCVKIEGYLVYLSCIQPGLLKEWLAQKIEAIKNNIPTVRENILHPEIYEQKQAEERAKYKAARAIEDQQEHERKEARAKAAQNAYNEQIKAFSGDGWITWETFERACKENGISMPIKTIGFGRKNISEIRKGQVRQYGKHTSPVIFEAANKLNEKLNKPCAA